ncbi:hypothetical protein [Burkholderia sp. 22313]|uniref:hypothetical protein n=1 Tax=Burkholderia sp. 22313 TaxID=3453908 RepID=UPI003F84155C
MKKFEIVRHWQRCMFGALLAVLSCNTSAQTIVKLQYGNVINSYGACSWQNNGDGTSTISLVVNYRPITGNLGKTSTGELRPDTVFNSRGVMVYTYDGEGRMNPSSATAKYVVMNGTRHSKYYDNHVTYVMYYALDGQKPAKPLPGWDNKGAHSATIEVLVDNSVIKDWPGIAIRAGNYTTGDDVGEITGAAYVSSIGSGSSCKVIDPEIKPPQPPAAIMVDAVVPDWNLGELPRGDGEKTLAGVAEQLCFTYTRKDEGYRSFVINATSENGILDNRYLLKNTSKPSQTVPYDLTLDSGSARFALPNTAGSPVQLNQGNRTCFVPTFRTSVGSGADAGDYSDVLSFTIITKS